MMKNILFGLMAMVAICDVSPVMAADVELREDEKLFIKLKKFKEKAEARSHFTNAEWEALQATHPELEDKINILDAQRREMLKKELPAHIDLDFLTPQTLQEACEWSDGITQGSPEFRAIKTELAKIQKDLKKMSKGYYPEKMYETECAYYNALLKYNQQKYGRNLEILHDNALNDGFGVNFWFSYRSVKFNKNF